VNDPRSIFTRRSLLQRTGAGIGAAALARLLGDDTNPMPDRHRAHHAPRAKSVIYIHLVGIDRSKTIVTDVSDTVTIDIYLVGVRLGRTVVLVTAGSIEVQVVISVAGTRIARITLAVAVVIGLIQIGDPRAVVTYIPNPVTIQIYLVGIR
jgi:hypothetical protein